MAGFWYAAESILSSQLFLPPVMVSFMDHSRAKGIVPSPFKRRWEEVKPRGATTSTRVQYSFNCCSSCRVGTWANWNCFFPNAVPQPALELKKKLRLKCPATRTQSICRHHIPPFPHQGKRCTSTSTVCINHWRELCSPSCLSRGVSEIRKMFLVTI